MFYSKDISKEWGFLGSIIVPAEQTTTKKKSLRSNLAFKWLSIHKFVYNNNQSSV